MTNNKCIFEARLYGFINIKKNTKDYKTIKLEGIATSENDTDLNICDDCQIQAIAPLIQSALRQSSKELKNIFAPKAYIIDKRMYKDKAIFKINMGASEGIKAGNKVEILSEYIEIDPINNKKNKEYKIISKGIISKEIGNNYACIKAKDNVQNIKKYDLVKG